MLNQAVLVGRIVYEPELRETDNGNKIANVTLAVPRTFKNQDGEYDKMYLSVQLPKGVELENKTMIEITKGFMSFYKTKEGLPKLKIVVMDFETENKREEAEQLDDLSLPF